MNAIDTNVFVYAFDDSSPTKREVARSLLASVSDGVLLWQVACEFVSASRKGLPAKSDLAVVWSRLAELRAAFPLVLPTDAMLTRAAELQCRTRIQFWDSLIYSACLEAGIGRLYSEDMPGCTIEGLEIVNPFA